MATTTTYYNMVHYRTASCSMLLLTLLPNLLLLLLGASCSSPAAAAVESAQKWELLMPGVTVEKGETYICYGRPVDTDNDHYIIGFDPKAKMDTAHHMLLYGCGVPGSDKPLWNCGEMGHSKSGLPLGDPCGSNAQVIYAWAMDAPKLELPKDVGFKVGGESGINYLVLQVHYAVPVSSPDHSGVVMTTTDAPMSKQAGVYLLATGGKVEPGETEHFETACQIDEQVYIHPFAYRTHTHGLGKVVSGYVVRGDTGQWDMIGKKNPRLPQMFYPVGKDITVRPGDIMAARCTMENTRDHTVHVGPTNEDEMCNFYVMYWVERGPVLERKHCLSYGPPYWYWSQYTDPDTDDLVLANPPEDASRGDPKEDELARKHHH